MTHQNLHLGKCWKLLCVTLANFSARIYGLLTKREVKVAEYWPSSVYLFACLWTLRSKNNEANIQPSSVTEQG